MKIPSLMFALASILASTADAQPSMTIYGTFDKDKDARALPSQTQGGSIPAKTVFGIDPTHSSISIYGTIDGGIRNVTNTTAEGGSTRKISSNGEYYNNRIGIKGAESLGGGISTHFHLEAGFNTGTGALDNSSNRLFNRISSLGLAGDFGSIDFGRQPSIACKAIYSYEPFQYRYVHIIPLAGAVAGNADGNTASNPFGTMGNTRLNNSTQYFRKFGGFTASAEYSMGEVAGSTSSEAAKAVALVYTNGTYTLGGAYTKQKPNVAVSGAPDYRDQDQITFGGAYKEGALRVAAGYIRTKTDTATMSITHQAKNTWVGASYAATPAIGITAGYYRTIRETANAEVARRNLAIVGVTYTLSKRTLFYAGIDRASLVGTVSVVAGKKTLQTGVSFGINHMF